MDIQTIKSLFKPPYLLPTVSVLLIFASAGAWVWTEYKSLQENKSEFEKYRTDQEISLEHKKSEFTRQQLLLSQNNEAEMRIEALMSEFASMGVNLNIDNDCSDNERTKRQSANTKYAQILAIAEASHLKSKYVKFFENTKKQYYIIDTTGCK